MMYRHRKAQTATEYLIILAVVIIIALIVVGVLGGIPGIGGSSSASASNAYWQTAPIGVQAYAFAQTGADSLSIRNNQPSSIVITDVRITPTLSEVGTSSLSTVFANATSASLSNQTLKSGETYKYQSNSTPSTYIGETWSQVNCNAGEGYSFYLQVDYRDVQTGATYTFDGDENTINGVCAN